MTRLRLSILLLALSLAISGCLTPKAQFVLLEDPDGHVGHITVTNAAGSAEITGAREAVRISQANRAPTTRAALAEETVSRRYGELLDQLPPPPVAFSVEFLPGSAKLAPGSEEALQRALEAVRNRDSRDVSLNGHTDTVGNPAMNLELSLQRAEAVRRHMMNAGLSADTFTIEYYGESDPVVVTADEVDEPKNRRVEIVVR